MKVIKETIICDICKSKIKEDNEEVNIPPDSLTYNYGVGAHVKFDDICQVCAKKIRAFIDELRKD